MLFERPSGSLGHAAPGELLVDRRLAYDDTRALFAVRLERAPFREELGSVPEDEIERRAKATGKVASLREVGGEKCG
jgi:hypothetical protein